MDEANLIICCKQGDTTAQRLLYETHAATLMPLCLRYLANAEDAEDALLSGFLKAFQSIAGFEYRGAGSVRGWLARIMVNECLMLLRRRQLQFINDRKAGGDEETCDEDIFAQLAAKDLFRLIATLPDGYRTVFNLYAVEGYTHREIGTLLGITEGASKSQYSKAKGALRGMLHRSNPQPKTKHHVAR